MEEVGNAQVFFFFLPSHGCCGRKFSWEHQVEPKRVIQSRIYSSFFPYFAFLLLLSPTLHKQYTITQPRLRRTTTKSHGQRVYIPREPVQGVLHPPNHRRHHLHRCPHHPFPGPPGTEKGKGRRCCQGARGRQEESGSSFFERQL